MKYTKFIIITALAFVLFFGYNRWVFSWGLFQLFDEQQYSVEGHEKVRNFNPDIETFYLPGIEGKDFFNTVKDFSICRRKQVREFLYIYLTIGREYTIRSIERSFFYIDSIKNIMKDNPDIPDAIALLPLLESGFDPAAVSRSNAVGLWQFMKRTASFFGLKKNRLVDERLDVIKSTEAAIRHLRHLYLRFGSWELALAAYNGGEGMLSRAIEKVGTEDIWQLIDAGMLPVETAEYVPRFAALLLIYHNSSLFGIDREITGTNKPVIRNVVF